MFESKWKDNWKFTTLNSFKQLLENNTFKITLPGELNDSGEFKMRFNIFTEKDFFDELEKNFQQQKDYFERIVGHSLSLPLNADDGRLIWKTCERDVQILTEISKQNYFFRSNYLIFSFSKGISKQNQPLDDLSMWAHYADCNAGVAYSFTDDLISNKIYEIKYDQYPPGINLSFSKISVSEKGNPCFNFSLEDFEAVATKKQHVWSHENEYRCIYEINDDNVEFSSFNNIFLSKFSKPWHGTVALGYKVPESEIRRIIYLSEQKMKKDSQWPGIDIIQASEYPNQYKYVFKPIYNSLRREYVNV